MAHLAARGIVQPLVSAWRLLGISRSARPQWKWFDPRLAHHLHPVESKGLKIVTKPGLEPVPRVLHSAAWLSRKSIAAAASIPRCRRGSQARTHRQHSCTATPTRDRSAPRARRRTVSRPIVASTSSAQSSSEFSKNATSRRRSCDLDDASVDASTDLQSALQIACSSRKPEILQQLKPDPAREDLRELKAASGPFSTTPETVAYWIRQGADVNDRPDGGSRADAVPQSCRHDRGSCDTLPATTEAEAMAIASPTT